jgi:glycosyltransferase involved in cell wall biosynthesis
LVWVEESLEMPGVYSALDIVASCSSSEGFSNVLGEAMACGVPCAVTDVGDSRAIVADLGEVVPAGDVAAMAAAWARLATRLSPTLKELCRHRVEQEYSTDRMVMATLGLFVNQAR